MMTDDVTTTTLYKIAVMKACLDGKPIQYKDDDECDMNGGEPTWNTISGEPTWNWMDYQYRIAVVPDSINWDHVHPDWKFMARDEDGVTYLYSSKPDDDYEAWHLWNGNAINVDCFTSYKQGTVDWKDSLVERPQ